MVKKRQRKKNYNKWASEIERKIWARRPKELTKQELNQWMNDQIENEGLLSWSTYQGIIEAIRDMKAGRLQAFDSVEEFKTSLDEDDDDD